MPDLEEYLASISRHRAAAFIIPDSWPTAAKTLSKIGPGRVSWTCHQAILQNTCHGGAIETDHRLVCSLQLYFGRYFLIPDATVNTPAALSPLFDHDIAPLDSMQYDQLHVVRPGWTNTYR